jgi:hypothetical protein
MLRTLDIPGQRGKGKVRIGTFFTTIVKKPMPRRRVPTRISDPDARLVAGRMMFAAAAEALGGVYGCTAMERELAFSPRARAERKASASGAGRPAKLSLPTGTCKKWLKGHVPIDQTLALIAELHPNVADRMQQVRDGEVVKALTLGEDNYRFVASRITALSPKLYVDYLGCMALGHCNPALVSRLTAGLVRLAMAEVNGLAVIIGTDRQLRCPPGSGAARRLDKAFNLALSHAAVGHVEVAFSRAALAEAWSRRRPRGSGPKLRRKSP